MACENYNYNLVIKEQDTKTEYGLWSYLKVHLWGTWLARLVKNATLDLGVMNSSSTQGIEISKKTIITKVCCDVHTIKRTE